MPHLTIRPGSRRPGAAGRTSWTLVLATACALAAGACGSRSDGAAVVPPGPALPPAPYVKPVVGTRLTYDGFTSVIVKAENWRVDFRDDRGVLGARVGGFMPDKPEAPLALDFALLNRLWPLKTGNLVDIQVQRYPLIWSWHLVVTGTAHVETKAGSFDCFVVESTETPIIGTSNQPYTDMTRFWYAPSIGHVVRIEAERVGGSGAGAHHVAELVSIEVPGQAGGQPRRGAAR